MKFYKILNLINSVEKEYYKGNTSGFIKVEKQVLDALKKGLLNELN